ncbi:hypothetical protein AKJ56_02310 [candidate division MSBL1 archaeon SCGC-AAA382N08]|uniref:Uncharacterized protein n=1 Tax=candidate division MSBL1 archaeon SCGC-AAA382N08 TaxID=1698285 RepID=A0A133VMX4_9EURY|nr:hypothetical protein AKJ56_02310 [candidate division MSBL1 archaeon SCGC-AAA382N08]
MRGVTTEKKGDREGKNKEKNLSSRRNEKNKRETSSDIITEKLGDRFNKRIEELEERRKKGEVGLEEKKKELTDFFEEITRHTEKHPELENVKVSELKKAITQVGMSHPEEVIDILRKKEHKTKPREMEEEWITY